MNVNDLLALVPLIIISAIPVVLMIVVTVVRDRKLSNVITLLGLIAALIAALDQFSEPAIQITPLLYLDPFNLLFVIAILISAIAVTMLSLDYFDDVVGLIDEYYILLSIAVLGAAVLICSSHMASFFIGIEMLGLSLFAMVGYLVAEPADNQKRAGTLEGSVKYLILSGVSSAFLLFGMALVYADTGAMLFTELRKALVAGELMAGYSLIGFVMITIGLGFKLSLVPFHIWTPDVYEGAPLPVTTFLATISKVAVCAFGLRFFLEAGMYKFTSLITMIALLAGASMIIGNVLALRQQNLKRLLAYSSIAHFGYIMLAFVAAAQLLASQTISVGIASQSLAVYLIAYLAMTLCAFGALIALGRQHAHHHAEFDRVEDLTGLLWQKPILAFVFIVALLSLAGIPLTLGFIAKFLLFAAGVSAQLWTLLILLVVGSALGLYYYLGVILVMIKPTESTHEGEKTKSFTWSHVVLASLTLVTLGLGVFPAPLLNVLAQVGAAA